MPVHRADKLHNITSVKQFRKQLRNNLTPAEATLWKILKESKLNGKKFRRQHSVGPYVLDFYCPAERLAIELDGEVHSDPLVEIHDSRRRAYLRDKGIKVLRFENKFVFEETERLLMRVESKFGWWKK